MTLKRQWMLVLILTVFVSVIINSVVLSSLINRYFVDYTTENYDRHVTQIVEFSKKALLEGDYTRMQLAIQLEAHLSDPIVEIQLFNAEDQLVVSVSSEINRRNGMMNNRMMNRVVSSSGEEVDVAEIKNNGELIGKINIVRYGSLGNSLGTKQFNAALIGNSIFAFGLVLLLVLIFGSIISRRMSRDLMNTAALATDIDLGNQTEIQLSKVKEIRSIQQSLGALQSKLRLKQTSRKKLVDELVHQTRTPLTILRAHLEGFGDGIMEMSQEEIKICEEQIDNITSIVSNMSGMIDAEKEVDVLHVEEFEFGQLVKQIAAGLKAQFDKKQIQLAVEASPQAELSTDKYKVSQSVYNILTNAYKFTDPGGKVRISHHRSGNELIVEIKDTGIGIAPEDRDRIFDAYFRGNNTEGVLGEGIGLYVARENMHKINGTIQMETVQGQGTTFILRIPMNLE